MFAPIDALPRRYRQAVGRLLPGWKPLERPQIDHWRPWVQPEPKLPSDKIEEIDRCITDLISGTGKQKVRVLLSPSQLTERGILCPYLHARFNVLQAAWIAGAYDRAHIQSTHEKAITLTAEGLRLQDALRDFVKAAEAELTIMALTSADALARINLAETNARRSLNYKDLKVAEDGSAAISRIAEALTKEANRIDPGRVSKNNFGQIFAEMMGYSWIRLTGKKPTNDDLDFRDFVQSALQSLDPTEKRHGSEWSIRKAIEKVANRPDWDRFDRHLNELYPPGVRTRMASEIEKERALRWQQKSPLERGLISLANGEAPRPPSSREPSDNRAKNKNAKLARPKR